MNVFRSYEFLNNPASGMIGMLFVEREREREREREEIKQLHN